MAREELTLIGGPCDLERRVVPEVPSVYLVPTVNMEQLSEWAVTSTDASELHLDVARYRTYRLPTYVSADKYVWVGVYDG